jgi:hypothetical protein
MIRAGPNFGASTAPNPVKTLLKYSVLSRRLGKKYRGSWKIGAKNMPEALRNQLPLEHLQKDSVVK